MAAPLQCGLGCRSRADGRIHRSWNFNGRYHLLLVALLWPKSPKLWARSDLGSPRPQAVTVALDNFQMWLPFIENRLGKESESLRTHESKIRTTPFAAALQIGHWEPAKAACSSHIHLCPHGTYAMVAGCSRHQAHNVFPPTQSVSAAAAAETLAKASCRSCLRFEKVGLDSLTPAQQDCITLKTTSGQPTG
jgi:hypothetical protein